MSGSITAVVVTFNRKALLARCLAALGSQSRPPDRILVVDNASTDGTREFIEAESGRTLPTVELLALPENTGGAGGFSAGIAFASAAKADWTWLMDDDAVPHRDALERLMQHARDPRDLYGSVAVQDDTLSWPMVATAHDGTRQVITSANALPQLLDVEFIPFLGLLVGKETVDRIGLPDPDYFIAADDVEYCVRARKHGARIMLVGDSRIDHPASERYDCWLAPRRLHTLRLSPWKRYYDVRNRLLVARKHYGLALYYSTIPGTLFRLATTLWHGPARGLQARAFLAGMIDGIAGRKGRRHEAWGLRP